ncbi:hypothetical protein C8F04DRAFT_1198482 [Mycena alexandri]|uniref:Uncharacterized protein n=1 Tax=Mycena alexandri TaxID=1745969 RepID=A0AAD6WN38_9AGAR|nr:hypothetical protein C8F04DRAFT_1198482 [Mycena alexandri]
MQTHCAWELKSLEVKKTTASRVVIRDQWGVPPLKNSILLMIKKGQELVIQFSSGLQSQRHSPGERILTGRRIAFGHLITKHFALVNRCSLYGDEPVRWKKRNDATPFPPGHSAEDQHFRGYASSVSGLQISRQEFYRGRVRRTTKESPTESEIGPRSFHHSWHTLFPLNFNERQFQPRGATGLDGAQGNSRTKYPFRGRAGIYLLARASPKWGQIGLGQSQTISLRHVGRPNWPLSASTLLQTTRTLVSSPELRGWVSFKRSWHL